MGDYEAFISAKTLTVPEVGFEPPSLPSSLYPFQREMTETALRRGRAAMYAECGLGKSLCQLAWAQAVAEHTGKAVLILAPLAVAQQTVREGQKFGVPCRYVTNGDGVKPGELVVLNYERLQGLDASPFAGVVCDESSILRNYVGVTKQRIIETFARTPYKLSCSATPAPNDHLELGNQSEFLDVMTSHQMIARWFINDFEAGHYRLKGHAVELFWDWVSSWATMCALPTDMGPEYSNEGYVLPELRQHSHIVEVDLIAGRGDSLFRIPDLSATSVHAERRRTAADRARKIAELVTSEPQESWLIWSETDYEADEIAALLPDAANLHGGESLESKERKFLAFLDGTTRVLLTKPKVAGLGLNMQHCARMAFASSTYSFESWYQAIRRCWRFGQTRPVDVHMVMGSTELGVVDVLNRKKDEFETMRGAMMESARRRQHKRDKGGAYEPKQKMRIPTWLRSEASC